MKTLSKINVKLQVLLILVALASSCSDDSKALSESVLIKETETVTSENPIVDDYFVVTRGNSTILHILTNDTFTKLNNVRVIEVSTPGYGTVEVNEDEKTVTYIPSKLSQEGGSSEAELSNNEEKVSDNFTYKTEVVNADGAVNSNVGEVTLDIIGQDSVNPNAKLLFSSGFEGNVVMNAENLQDSRQYILGTDSETGFTWPPVLGGSSINALKLIQDGGNLFNEIRKVIGRTGAETKVMYNEKLDNTTDITQSPFQLENWNFNPDKFYVRYWMKVNNSFTGRNKFRAIWETKTYNYDSGDGFRMAVFMNMDQNGKESWELRGDTKPGVEGVVWSAVNNTIPFPKEEWFLVEFFVDFAKTGKGRVFFKVNGQTIGDVNEITNANSENIQVMMLTQIYGNEGHMYQYIDDIEIWDDVLY